MFEWFFSPFLYLLFFRLKKVEVVEAEAEVVETEAEAIEADAEVDSFDSDLIHHHLLLFSQRIV